MSPLTPAFTPLTFFGCVAGDHDTSYGVTGATLLDMPDPQGTDEVKTTIDEDMKLADALGVNGTPSYVVGNELIVGAVGLDELKEKIAADNK